MHHSLSPRRGSVFENLFIFQQTRQFSRLRAIGDGLQVASNAVTPKWIEVETGVKNENSV
jgi:hypothetical protein